MKQEKEGMKPNKRATLREVPAQLGPAGSSEASAASQSLSHPEVSVLPAVRQRWGWETSQALH